MDNTLKKKTLIWEENNEPPKNYIWMRNGVAYEYNYGTKSWEVSKLISSNGGTDSNAMHAYEITSLDEVQTPKEGDLAIIEEVKIPVEGGQITEQSVHISGDIYSTTWRINLDQSKTYLIEAGESADRIDKLYKGIIFCGMPDTSELNKNFPIVLTEATFLTMYVNDNWDGTSNPYINIYEYTPGEYYEYFNGKWTSRGDTSLSELSEIVLKRVNSILGAKPGDIYVTKEEQGASNIFSGLSTSNRIAVGTNEYNPVNLSSVRFTHFKLLGYSIGGQSKESANTVITIGAKAMQYDSRTIYTIQSDGIATKITDQDGNEYSFNQPIPIPTISVTMGSMVYSLNADTLIITESEGTIKLSNFLIGYLINPASFNIVTTDNSADGMPSSIISTTTQTGPVQYGSDSLVKSKDIYEYGKSLLDKSQRTYTISPESVTNPKEGDICNVPTQYNWISPLSVSRTEWAGNTPQYVETFDLNNWSNETLHVECTQYATYGSTQLIITYADNSEETFDSFPIDITNAISAKTFGQMATYPVFAFGIKTSDAQIKEYYNGEWTDRKLTTSVVITGLPTAEMNEDAEALAGIGITPENIMKLSKGNTALIVKDIMPALGGDRYQRMNILHSYFRSNNYCELIFADKTNKYDILFANSLDPTVTITPLA